MEDLFAKFDHQIFDRHQQHFIITNFEEAAALQLVKIFTIAHLKWFLKV
jgi:hypothetical protein